MSWKSPGRFRLMSWTASTISSISSVVVPSTYAHDGRLGEAEDGAGRGLAVSGVVLAVGDEGGGADAFPDGSVAHGCVPVGGRRREGVSASGGGMAPMRSSSSKRMTGCRVVQPARRLGRVSSPRVMTGPGSTGSVGPTGSVVPVVTEPPPPPPPQAVRTRSAAAGASMMRAVLISLCMGRSIRNGCVRPGWRRAVANDTRVA